MTRAGKALLDHHRDPQHDLGQVYYAGWVKPAEIEGFGYTARQAHFLALVALHGGYFLRRQYVAFTGVAHGQAVVRFIAHTVAREHVRALPYGRHGHMFHLCARPIYAAIGERCVLC